MTTVLIQFVRDPLTLHIDGECVGGALRSSEEWWGHTDIAGVLPSIRHSKWVKGEGKRATSSWCHTPTGVEPWYSGSGGQSLSPSNSGCAGEGVGLASIEWSSWGGDGGTNCECGDCRESKITTWGAPILALRIRPVTWLHSVHKIAVPISWSPKHSCWGLVLAETRLVQWVI